jgi:hypothetical protein
MPAIPSADHDIRLSPGAIDGDQTPRTGNLFDCNRRPLHKASPNFPREAGMARNAITSATQEAADRSAGEPKAREPEIRLRARSVGAEERQRMIQEAAYYRYVRRDHAAGHELDDWLAAEVDVDRLLEQSAEIEELARAAT